MKQTEIIRIIEKSLSGIVADVDKDIDSKSVSIVDCKHTSIARLWAGMGHVYRVDLTLSLPSKQTACPQLAIKHIVMPSAKRLSVGDERKRDSYQVEANFYEHVVPQLDCSLVPKRYYVERPKGNEVIMVMSYIQHSTKNHYLDNAKDVELVLSWLAKFHAAFWGRDAIQDIVDKYELQPIATYWYLPTRLDEYNAMPSRGWQGRLKRAAKAIHDYLHDRDPWQCLVHGDVKDANVIFTNDNGSEGVVLCDFQYCGRGSLTKDLAYFFSSSVGGNMSRSTQQTYLQYYLDELSLHLSSNSSKCKTTHIPTLDELNDSLDLAYADFFRFMSGWGFWASSDLGEERVLAVLNRLDGGTILENEDDYETAMLQEYG